MEIVRITRSDFERFRELQRRRRWDWPAVFSSNEKGEIWAYRRPGWTPFEEREELRGVSAVLDRIAVKYHYVRSERGRFFIDECGAFWKDKSGQKVQFVEFVWDEQQQ
jgi:hypothetical protein